MLAKAVMAPDHLAARHQGPAVGEVRRRAGAGRRWAEVRLQGRTGQHLPGDEAWLVGEHRASGERKYYLSNLPPDTR